MLSLIAYSTYPDSNSAIFRLKVACLTSRLLIFGDGKLLS